MLTLYVPSSTKNSPTKLPIPGSPSEARAKKSMAPPMRGATGHKPPMRRVSRVRSRSCKDPTNIKRAPALIPWQSI